MGCTDCDDELEHCHGVLVRHADGRRECLDPPACDAVEPAHGWAVPCADLGCPCAEEPEVLPVAA
jgi:hypothetical protein